MAAEGRLHCDVFGALSGGQKLLQDLKRGNSEAHPGTSPEDLQKDPHETTRRRSSFAAGGKAMSMVLPRDGATRKKSKSVPHGGLMESTRTISDHDLDGREIFG